MSIQRSISDSNQQSASGVGVASLIERLEKASGPDRELDLAIHIALNPDGDVARVTAAYPRGLHSHDGLAWELGTNCVLYENWSNNQCWSNGGYQVPAVTESIDAAMTLVPLGWCCGFENGGKFDRNPNSEAWCWPYNSDFEPDWQNGDEGYRSAPDAHRGVGTPAIALCIAALKARTLSESSS